MLHPQPSCQLLQPSQMFNERRLLMRIPRLGNLRNWPVLHSQHGIMVIDRRRRRHPASVQMVLALLSLVGVPGVGFTINWLYHFHGTVPDSPSIN